MRYGRSSDTSNSARCAPIWLRWANTALVLGGHPLRQSVSTTAAVLNRMGKPVDIGALEGRLATQSRRTRTRSYPPSHSTRAALRKPGIRLRLGAPLRAATHRSLRRSATASAGDPPNLLRTECGLRSNVRLSSDKARNRAGANSAMCALADIDSILPAACLRNITRT